MEGMAVFVERSTTYGTERDPVSEEGSATSRKRLLTASACVGAMLVGRGKRGRMTSTHDARQGGCEEEEKMQFSSTTNTTTKERGEPSCIALLLLTTRKVQTSSHDVKCGRRIVHHPLLPSSLPMLYYLFGHTRS